MATYLGLDIGTKSIKGAVVTGTPKKLKVQEFFVEEIPELTLSDGPPEAEDVDLEAGLPPSVGELVKKVIAERKLQGMDVIACLNAKDCVLRDRIKVPFTRDDQIQKTIEFEAENHLITFDVEEMILEYVKVGEADGESVLLLMAFQHEAIAERLETLKEGGVDPVMLDIDGAALFNAFALTPTFDPARSTLLIDVGATTTKVVLIQDGKIKTIRSLRLGSYLGVQTARRIAQPVGAGVGEGGGFELADSSSIEARFEEIETSLRRLETAGVVDTGDSIDTALDQEFGSDDDQPIAILTDDEYHRVTDEAAEQGESAGGETTSLAPASDGVAAPAKEYDYEAFLRRLGLEIQRTFSTSTMAPIELICLTGGLANRDEARRFFSDNFDVETITLDFGGSGDSFEHELDSRRLDELNRVGAVAVGLAVKELGHDRVGLDFRKKQFRFERRFEKLKFPLLCLAVMTCALFLYSAYDSFKLFNARKHQLASLRATGRDYFEAFFGDEPKGQSILAGAVAQKRKDYESWLGTGSEIPKFLPELEAIRHLANSFQEAKKQRLDFTVENINMGFELRSRRQRGGSGRPGAETLEIERSWTVKLIAPDKIGEDFRRILNKGNKWSVEVSERGRGTNTEVTLQLSPTDSYLQTLNK